MECRCEKDNFQDEVSGWWPNSSSIQMGTFTVVGYLLYRFSQTLPALIRWPIRLFCSLTGLSALWGWVSRLVGTIRVVQTLFRWLSGLWHFFIAFSSKYKWLVAVIRAILGGSSFEAPELETDWTGSSLEPGLRLILLGPAGGGQTFLVDALLGSTETRSPVGPPTESTRRRTVANGREVTVISTPDLLEPSLGNGRRAREALRSLQLAAPGPHAFLLVIPAPGSRQGMDQDATRAVQATLELFGVGVVGHIVPVLTHARRLGRSCTVEHLLRSAESLCGQRPELLDGGADRPPEAPGVIRRQLLGRVLELRKLRGHFVHELQGREERFREELLAEMSSALARKLGHE